ncbi:MAG TPA: cupin domain-containing protein [Solirubrobacteraceae bacterium]|jgi:mannose-6-phosphate isomerase-like protein (cupin superfamily)|nr:cupin domain-containing protein [Solirubrobacteraceae bacterium]
MPDTAEPRHFQIHVKDVPSAAVTAEDGWQSVDIRWMVGNEKAGSKAGSDEICFWRTRFQPGAAHARHYHPNAAEAFFIIRGRGAAGTGDEEHEVLPGTALYIPAGVVHWFRNAGDEELELVGCYAPGGSLEDAGYVFVGDVTSEYRQVV